MQFDWQCSLRRTSPFTRALRNAPKLSLFLFSSCESPTVLNTGLCASIDFQPNKLEHKAEAVFEAFIFPDKHLNRSENIFYQFITDKVQGFSLDL